jgi:hypothetical protein
MSFPVARPDRRILARRRCAEPCVIEYGQGETAPGVLRQLDPHGARVRLLQHNAAPCGDVRILTQTGDEVFGATAWRIGDVVGVRRHARSEARSKALRAS